MIVYDDMRRGIAKKEFIREKRGSRRNAPKQIHKKCKKLVAKRHQKSDKRKREILSKYSAGRKTGVVPLSFCVR